MLSLLLGVHTVCAAPRVGDTPPDRPRRRFIFRAPPALRAVRRSAAGGSRPGTRPAGAPGAEVRSPADPAGRPAIERPTDAESAFARPLERAFRIRP
ncbi:MAG: hypothetical protein HSCHL_2238 [Hydrogenibacillus schlegelii]|uniref:Uncharacterized protein n=1 Tax=Hydrogenibacillus schlegelii TaxID=1484 RepID=A0A2T5GEM8_HYDSH|nr:MAG: hypothetical protein HSCHL_2238 [Hydrogenibacillus schlegelii]